MAKETKEGLLLAILIRFAGILATAISGILLLPLFLKVMGVSTYGTWTAITSITAMFLVLDPGLGNLNSQRLSTARASGDKISLRKMASCAVLFSLCSGLFIASAGGVFANQAASLLSEGEAQLNVVECFMITTKSIGCMASIFGLSGVIAGLGFTKLASVVLLMPALVRPALLFVALSSGGDIVLVAFADLASSLYSLLICCIVVAYIFVREKISFELDFVAAKKYSLAFMFTSLARVAKSVAAQLDGAVVGSQLGGAASAVYSVAMTGPRVAEAAIGLPVSVARPFLAYSATSSEARKTICISGTLAALALIVFAVGLLVTVYPLLLRWLTPEVADDVRLIIGPISLLFMIKVSTNIISVINFSMGEVEKNSVAEMVSSILVVLFVFVGCAVGELDGVIYGHAIGIVGGVGWYFVWRLVKSSAAETSEFAKHLLLLFLCLSIVVLEIYSSYPKVSVIKNVACLITVPLCLWIATKEVLRLWKRSDSSIV